MGSWNGQRTPATPVTGVFGSDGHRVVWVPTASLKKAQRVTFDVAQVRNVSSVMVPVGARQRPALVFIVGESQIPVTMITTTTPAKLLAKLSAGPLAKMFGA